ncbi:MAG: ribosomal protein S18-alanine N-acetyltransferase [Gammaproteobacteria bacterium]|nr:ribosomal-protein-alanine N-acetyltransferase [Rhodocyclaceae bacterium]MBU3908457.1 ribosomal protein S18-alanine N-acetyltransferase [Gammaproteobacteria bacterium]MBU3990286.1 ribosomal protein S18-alanine N-acetyltransferase [Gammaproteobacteria bacterium]MBU4005403.1 ribosomal protein S18-alanine N-acetyltransferase [Gammaproteobacteria bacterium]MBU4021088.1 ribosomal protein S18-alanine N-acetyltransferase [Gammaproteobacteria bacterium]
MGEADLPAVTAAEQRIHRFPWTLGNFHDSLLAGHEAWLQRESGELLAFAVMMGAVDESHLLNISVVPERQRSGLGRALLEFLCDQARQGGMVRMLLEVRAANQNAIAFYQHFAFVEIGRRRGYYPDSTGREDAIVMSKKL